MLCLIFHMPSDKFQSALCYDAVVQYSLCYVGSSMCLHFKVHRSISLVLIRYVQYSMCYDASSTGLLLHIKCNVQ